MKRLRIILVGEDIVPTSVLRIYPVYKYDEPPAATTSEAGQHSRVFVMSNANGVKCHAQIFAN